VIADDVALVDVCARSKKPYVLICQANAESCGPPTNMPCELSMSTREQARFLLFLIKTVAIETQLDRFATGTGCRNPFNVRQRLHPRGLRTNPVRLACIAALSLIQGGRSVLRVLASEPWRSRPLSVSFFGRGYHEEEYIV